MRLFKIYTIVYCLLMSVSLEAQPCALLSFTKPTINGDKLRITLNMKACSADFGLGSNNFRFNYNSFAISNPTIISEIFPSPEFASSTTNGSSVGLTSINTAYSGSVNSNVLPITAAGQDLIELEFDIVNKFLKTGFSWRTTANPTVALVTDDKITKINVMTNNLDIPLSNDTIVAIRGVLAIDFNKDCVLNAGNNGFDDDSPLRLHIIKASNLTEGDIYGIADNNGIFEIFIPNKSVPYTISTDLDNTIWTPCQSNIVVPNPSQSNGQVIPILFQAVKNCISNEINVSTPFLRHCFSNTYTVNVKNVGTIKSLNSSVVITLDDYLTMISASRPYVSLGNNKFSFDLGTLKVEEFSQFTFVANASCDSTVNHLGEMHCVGAEIFPSPNCDVNDEKPVIRGTCENGKIKFDVENQALTAIVDANYVIIEDDMIFKQAALPNLNPTQIFNTETIANGSTWRLEVRQNNELIGATFVEGCGTNAQGTYSTGFANKLPLPSSTVSEDIECKEVIVSFDPNDKQGVPLGLSAQHFIEPNTPIEYLIRFQNMGNDTAFNVIIEDLIDEAFLDFNSIKIIGASHKMNPIIKDRTKLVFNFKDILLPDSSKSQSLSQGFVRFSISQKKDVKIGAVIKNKAVIYFDANKAVITNETFHTVGRDFLMVKSQELFLPNVEVVVRPNPMNDKAILEVKGLDNSGLQLEVFDLLGRNVLSKSTDNQYFEINKGQINGGFYMYRIFQNKQLIASGKILVE